MKTQISTTQSMLCAACILALLMALAAPVAMAEKAAKKDTGHVMHEYADMAWPFHNDTMQSSNCQKSTVKSKNTQEAKEVTNEKKSKKQPAKTQESS